MQTSKIIKNNEEAQAQLAIKVTDRIADEERLKSDIGVFNSEEMEEAEMLLSESDYASMSVRHWQLIRLDNLRHEIKGLQETQKANLIFPDGKYLLLPKGERLISPAGFHPDQKVFIQPSEGALVSHLPKSSNMSYYDFT
jgi:hypothetical protein